MSPVRIVCVTFLFCLTSPAYGQSVATASDSPERVENGLPIMQLITTVQKKIHKKFVVDPRVRGDVLMVGKDVSDMSYGDLLTILQVYGYIAVEQGGYVEVLPIANARQTGAPVISGKETRPDSEIVTRILGAKNISVMQLVPILRPMIPQYGHLAALPCVNKMIMVDTYANIRRIEAVIESLDVGEPFKPEKCEARLSEHP